MPKGRIFINDRQNDDGNGAIMTETPMHITEAIGQAIMEVGKGYDHCDDDGEFQQNLLTALTKLVAKIADDPYKQVAHDETFDMDGSGVICTWLPEVPSGFNHFRSLLHQADSVVDASDVDDMATFLAENTPSSIWIVYADCDFDGGNSWAFPSESEALGKVADLLGLATFAGWDDEATAAYESSKFKCVNWAQHFLHA